MKLHSSGACEADGPDLEPASYVNYYKRATAYLSLGRHSAALDDFDHILRLNPGFVQVSSTWTEFEG